jgi:hypothetical protein
MAWTAHLDAFTKDPTSGNIVATVSFTDGTSTMTQQIPGNNLDAPTLATFCTNFINTLQARDAAITTLAVGPIVSAALTPAQIAANDFFAKLAVVRGLRKQVTEGFLLAADPSIAVAVAAAKLAFLPIYMTDPRF